MTNTTAAKTMRPALKAEALEFLGSLPVRIRTCEQAYGIALALSREGAVRLTNRTVLGNGQVRYDVECLCWRHSCVRCDQRKAVR